MGQEDIEGGSASKTTESGLQSSKNGGDGGNAAAVVEDDVPAEEVLPSSMVGCYTTHVCLFPISS